MIMLNIKNLEEVGILVQKDDFDSNDAADYEKILNEEDIKNLKGLKVN